MFSRKSDKFFISARRMIDLCLELQARNTTLTSEGVLKGGGGGVGVGVFFQQS